MAFPAMLSLSLCALSLSLSPLEVAEVPIWRPPCQSSKFVRLKATYRVVQKNGLF